MPKTAKKEKQDNSFNPQEKGRIFETIDPPKKLKDIIRYKELKKGNTHPVENANKQVEFLSIDFALWIEDDVAKLSTSWQELKKDKENASYFLEFNKAVHTIKGNAAILGFEKTGELSVPLSQLLERSHEVDKFFEAISLMVQAIILSTQKKCTKRIKQTDCAEKANEIKKAFEAIIQSAIKNS